MKDVLTHKGFIGSVHFDSVDEIFHGKIEGINDLVTFEGNSVKKLTTAFKEAVEDYLKLCKIAGKDPMKSVKGSFNVRISPEVHKLAIEKAAIIGISLNQLVQKAIEAEVASPEKKLTTKDTQSNLINVNCQINCISPQSQASAVMCGASPTGSSAEDFKANYKM